MNEKSKTLNRLGQSHSPYLLQHATNPVNWYSWSDEAFATAKKENKPICIIIGPEGDFTENEREQIFNFKDLQSLKINSNILRSETAVISSLSIINYFLNL